MKPITEPMHLHSLGGKMAEATIIDKVGDNQYVAEYNGVKCTAIYNPFVDSFYVDDKYGILEGQPQERSHSPRHPGLER